MQSYNRLINCARCGVLEPCPTAYCNACEVVAAFARQHAVRRPFRIPCWRLAADDPRTMGNAMRESHGPVPVSVYESRYVL